MNYLQAIMLRNDAKNCGVEKIGIYEFSGACGCDEYTELPDMTEDIIASEFYVVMCNGRFSPLGYTQAVAWLESIIHGV